jgi:hypothetical protein
MQRRRCLLELNTHRVPLGIGLFHPSGLSASLRTTYFHQAGEFLRDGGVLSDFVERPRLCKGTVYRG